MNNQNTNMRTFYKDEENPYDYTATPVQGEVKVYRDEEKQPIPSFTVGDVMTEPSTNNLNWDGSKATYVGNLDRSQVTGCIVSNNLKLVAPTEKLGNVNFAGTIYVKMKEIRCSFGGTIRVSFDLKTGNGFGGSGRIYVNGVAVGTNRGETGSYVTYTEDLTINASDVVQFYGTEGAGEQTTVRNFSISFDRTVDGDGVILQD